MKKKRWIPILVIALLVFVPIPAGVCKDGGTRTFTALTYRLVVWNRLYDEPVPDENGKIAEVYHKTSVFWFPDNYKDIDELWEMEQSGK